MAGFRQALMCGRDAATAVKAVGGGTFTGAASVVYRVRVTTGGASGTAEVTVYDSTGTTVLVAAAAVTSGAAITLVDGATLTLTWSGADLVVGQEWACYADTGVKTVGRVEELVPGNGQAVRFARVNADGEMLTQAVMENTALTWTIANGASVSGEIDITGMKCFTLIMPAAWDAAAMTFQVSNASGGTFRDLYTDATSPAEVSLAVEAAKAYGLATIGGYLAGARFLKLRSGTTGTPVNQTAARTGYLLVVG